MILALLAVLALSAMQGVGAPAAQAKGEIRGRVTDKESGLPIARVTVRISGPDGKGSMTTITTDAGLFRFAGLAAGRYSGRIEPGHFRATHLPQSISGAAGRADALTLAKDEIRDVNVALARAHAITVRVVDSWGEPLSGLSVGAHPDGRRGFFHLSFQHTTDDHGRLRLFGLSPGRYILCAEPNPLGGSQGTNAPPGRGERLLRTCYPSAADDEQAEAVRIDRSDLGEVEIRMRRGRTFTIAGRIVDASGAPATNARAGLNRYVTNGNSGSGLAVDAEGRFRVSDVAPGAYAINASVGGPDRPEQRRPFEAGFVPIKVESDIDDIVVAMKGGVDVRGRFILEDPAMTLPQPPGSGLYISARLAEDRLPGSGSTIPTNARADRTFSLDRMFGRRFLEVQNVPRGWYVKSIRYADREIIDEFTEFKGGRDAPAVEIVLSNRGAVVTGRAVDESGKPVPRAQVLLLRIGKEGFPLLLSASTVASAVGAFKLDPARAGDYALVALPADAPYPQSGEWDRLSRFAGLGERVTLGELDERLVDLRVLATERR
jgi:hypothetical protein